MGIIAETDIRGYRLTDASTGTEIVCPECITLEDQEDITEEEIITEDAVEKDDRRYFCDRCKKEL